MKFQTTKRKSLIKFQIDFLHEWSIRMWTILYFISSPDRRKRTKDPGFHFDVIFDSIFLCQPRSIVKPESKGQRNCHGIDFISTFYAISMIFTRYSLLESLVNFLVFVWPGRFENIVINPSHATLSPLMLFSQYQAVRQRLGRVTRRGWGQSDRAQQPRVASCHHERLQTTPKLQESPPGRARVSRVKNGGLHRAERVQQDWSAWETKRSEAEATESDPAGVLWDVQETAKLENV